MTIDSWTLTVRAGADGYVRPGGSPETESILFFRVVVTAGSVDRALVVVPVWHPPMHDDDVAENEPALAEHVGAAIVFMREDRTGWSRVSCAPDVPAEKAAAATAVIKYRCSWDESDPITIVVGDRALDVTVRFSGEQYFADVRDSSPT